jgi:DNA primase
LKTGLIIRKLSFSVSFVNNLLTWEGKLRSCRIYITQNRVRGHDKEGEITKAANFNIMSKMIPRNIVEKIQEQTDLVSVVSEYVKLQPSGRSLKGLCPFHSERTPSFTVDPEKQLFHCFGCSEGGDVFAFLMKIENLSFPEAVSWAGQRCGIPMELGEDSQEDRKKQELFGIMELALDFYVAQLRQDSGEFARKYLENRGISAQTAFDFTLGLAPSGWESLAGYLSECGVSLALSESLGLVAAGKKGGYYDRFRSRLLFPIFDGRGRPIGFGGRLMGEGEPKYLNSPQTPLFYKGQQLYALHQAKQAIRRSSVAVVVEGYMDVLSAHQAGFSNTVASLGTALTAEQAKILARYSKRVILAYDADSAGQQATLRGMELLREAGLDVHVASLPKGEDPDSLIQSQGAAAFRNCLKKAEHFLDYQLTCALAGHDLATPRGRAQAGRKVVSFLQGIKNRIEREAYLKQAAVRLGLSPQSLMAEVERGRKEPRSAKPAKRTRPKVQIAGMPAYLRAERQLICLMLQKREIIEDVMHKLGGDNVFSNPAHRELAAGLVQGAAAGEELQFNAEPDPAITVDDCIEVILQHNAEQKLSLFADEFTRNLESSVELTGLMSATIKYKAFHDYLVGRLGRREG